MHRSGLKKDYKVDYPAKLTEDLTNIEALALEAAYDEQKFFAMKTKKKKAKPGVQVPGQQLLAITNSPSPAVGVGNSNSPQVQVPHELQRDRVTGCWRIYKTSEAQWVWLNHPEPRNAELALETRQGVWYLVYPDKSVPCEIAYRTACRQRNFVLDNTGECVFFIFM